MKPKSAGSRTEVYLIRVPLSKQVEIYPLFLNKIGDFCVQI
jgi:hypothetical protein